MISTIGITAVLLAALQPSGTESADEHAVRQADMRFWAAFNECNVEAMSGFFTEDAEFYHDRGGLTEGRQKIVDDLRQNLCTPGVPRVRREAIAGTVRYDPVPGYGAILTGEHAFYVTEPGKAEYLDGQARFAHVWRYSDGAWRMRRVLSYAHGPAQPVASTASVKISSEALARLAGRYRSPTQEVAEFSVENGRLKLVAGDLTLLLEPLSDSSFRATDRNLRFDFDENSVSVWENGSKVDEAKRID